MIVLGAEGTRKVGIKGWTERRMGVWYPTRGQIGNRSDPHGKHRNDARPFLINRQPLFFLRLALLSPLLQNSPILHPDPFRIEEIARRSLGDHSAHTLQLPVSLQRSTRQRKLSLSRFPRRETCHERAYLSIFLLVRRTAVLQHRYSFLYRPRFIMR